MRRKKKQEISIVDEPQTLTVTLVDAHGHRIAPSELSGDKKKIKEVENKLDGIHEVTWSTSDPGMLKVTPNPNDPYQAIVETIGGVVGVGSVMVVLPDGTSQIVAQVAAQQLQCAGYSISTKIQRRKK